MDSSGILVRLHVIRAKYRSARNVYLGLERAQPALLAAQTVLAPAPSAPRISIRRETAALSATILAGLAMALSTIIASAAPQRETIIPLLKLALA